MPRDTRQVRTPSALLRESVEGLLKIADDQLSLEVIIVDDCSKDKRLKIANQLAKEHQEIVILKHEVNQGKGGGFADWLC